MSVHILQPQLLTFPLRVSCIRAQVQLSPSQLSSRRCQKPRFSTERRMQEIAEQASPAQGGPALTRDSALSVRADCAWLCNVL